MIKAAKKLNFLKFD